MTESVLKKSVFEFNFKFLYVEPILVLNLLPPPYDCIFYGLH